MNKALPLQEDQTILTNHIVKQVVHYLSRSPNIHSIILVGSYARGDPNEYSDIDLVLISDTSLSRSELLAKLPSGENMKKLSLLPYPSRIFAILYMEGSLFMAHLLKEGLVLYDDGYYTHLTKQPFKISRESLLLQWDMLKQRVGLYDDLSIYGEVFIDCISHLYSLVKNVAIIALALKGELTFNKARALERLSILFPQLREDIAELTKLKPFSLIWSKGASISKPFSPINCRKKTETYLRKLRKIISEVEHYELKPKN